MKKILKNNQIIITALAIMIVIVWYLTYTDSNKLDTVATNTDSEITTDGTDAYISVGQSLTDNGLELNDLLSEESGDDYVTVNDDDVIADQSLESEDDIDVSDISDEDTALQEGSETTAETTAETTDTLDTTDAAAETTDTTSGYSEEIEVSDTGEVIGDESTESSTPGEAVLASTTISSSYFASAKLTREQNRAKEKENLLAMIENEELSEEAKQDAVDSMLELNETMEKESATEMLLEAKGFEGAVVSILDGSVDVVINAPTITEQQIAQIESIVKRKTGIESENIVINPVVVEE